MKRFIILLSVILCAAAAFCGDNDYIGWTFDNEYDNSFNEIVQYGVADSVYFPAGARGFSRLVGEEVVAGEGGDNWLVNGNIDEGVDAVFTFTFDGAWEDQLGDIKWYFDHFTCVVIETYDSEGNVTEYQFEEIEREDATFNAYLTTEDEVVGVRSVSINLNEKTFSDGTDGIGIKDIALVPVSTVNTADLPEPVTVAYGAFGLVSLMGMRRKIKK